jgi:hypothetical protein
MDRYLREVVGMLDTPNDFAKAIDEYGKAATSLAAKLKHSDYVATDLTFKSMQRRMMDGMNSLTLLNGVTEPQHDTSRDLAALFRVMYDLHLQFRYVLLEPKAHSFAYISYAHIEQHQVFQLLKPGPLYQAALAKTPELAKTDAAIDANYQKYRRAFEYEKDGKTKVRNHWYEGQLDAIVIKIDKKMNTKHEREYRLVQKVYSGAVHSSSLSLIRNTLPNYNLIMCGWALTMRVIGGIADHQQTTFTESERMAYAAGMLPFF